MMAQVLFFDTFFEKNPQLNSVEFPVIKDITKNYLEFKLTRIDGTVPKKHIIFLLQKQKENLQR